jgi:hypothetical protein
MFEVPVPHPLPRVSSQCDAVPNLEQSLDGLVRLHGVERRRSITQQVLLFPPDLTKG